MKAKSLLVVALLGLGACSEPDAPEAAAPEAAPEPPAAEPPAAADAADVLAPSPLALRKEVADAGLTVDLATLVPKRDFDMAAEDKNTVAVRAGVLLADTILAGETMPKEQFLAQLESLRAGLGSMGAGVALTGPMDRFITGVQNDGASQLDFVRQLDELSWSTPVDQGFGPNDQTGPLLQAGAWLEGTRVVAQAVVDSGDPAAANKLLKRGEVATWFLDYVKGEGADKAAGDMVGKISGALEQLATIGAKDELSLEDAKQIVATTTALFAML